MPIPQSTPLTEGYPGARVTRVKMTVDTHIPWWKEAGGLQLKTVSQGKTQGPRYVRSRKIQKESRLNETWSCQMMEGVV